jgi:hypothetical protein
MQARFQIRTSGELLTVLHYQADSPMSQPVVGLLTDSKALRSIQRPLVRKFLGIGLERAFSEMPANLKVFHPEAARRDL